jgi:hypothetical protein
MQVMRIVNWSEAFETAENKKLRRLTWLALPTKQEGDGYTELMSAHENGCAHFGAWTAMLQLAAKCSPRGTLVRDLGGRLVAHDLASISRITRVPAQVLGEAVPRLAEIGWLEYIDITELSESAGLPAGQDGKPSGEDGQPVVTGEGRTGEDSTGQHSGGEGTPAAPAPASPVSSGGPSSPETGKAKRRIDLLAMVKGRNAKLTLGKDHLFEEWVSESDGFHLEWIDHLMESVRPRIKLPSELRKALRLKAAEYQTWKAARK